MTTRTVLITGAARRIGAALARDLHAHGMNIIIHHHTSQQEAIQLAESLNATRKNSAFLLQVNLLETDSFDSIIATATGFTGRLDVLINNASMFYPTAVGETTPQQWAELFGTNVKAPYFLVQSCLKPLQASNGCVINITDIHGERPLQDHPVYSAAKAGLIMLTRALAKELGPDIRVNAISPGAILWPEDLSEDKRQQIVAKTALKRQGTTEDITRAVRYLINDAAYVTGQVINIDGGRVLF
jgi:pteridine reductase